MKYIKRFSKVSDYEAFKGGGEYITPNISLIDDGKRVYSEKKASSDNILTFPITLVEGDNGQMGIDLWNYILENATDMCLITGECYPGYYTFKSNEVVTAILPNGNSVNIPKFHFGNFKDVYIPSTANYATPDWWNIVIRQDGSVVMPNLGDV